jgi:hypothetical protein
MPAWYSLGAAVAGRVCKTEDGARKGEERAAEKASKLKSVVRYRARKEVRVERGEDFLRRVSWGICGSGEVGRRRGGKGESGMACKGCGFVGARRTSWPPL